jgi:hypothetical protein
VSQVIVHVPAAPRQPAWARPTHPVFRRELGRWQRSRAWRLLRASPWVAPLVLALGLLLAAGAGALSADTQALPSATALVAGATFVGVAATLSGLLNWLLGLMASLFGAVLIARERENQNWPFLRVTTLTSFEILGGKLAALLHMLAGPAHTIAAIRLAALLGGAGAVVFAAANAGFTLAELVDLADSLVAQALLPGPALLVTASVGGLDILIWLIYWLIEPYFNAVYNSLIGLAASTLASTRGRAIALVFVGHLVLSLAIYAPAQQIAYALFALGFRVGGGPGANVLTSLLVFSVQFGLLIGMQAAAMLACFAFSLRRLDHLGD